MHMKTESCKHGKPTHLYPRGGEGRTLELVRGLDEWNSFCFAWCRPRCYMDVNQCRSIWTKWVGVPLHAWNQWFFGLAYSKFRRLEELHISTANRLRLVIAFARVSTGLSSIDRLLQYRINGASFLIRVEEVNCMDLEKELHHGIGESESDEESECEEWSKADSVQTMIKNSSVSEDSGAGLDHSGEDTSFFATREEGGEQSILGLRKAVGKTTELNVGGEKWV